MLKSKYKRLEKKMLEQMIEKQCSFLKNNYTNIYNKLKNDVIDVKMLLKFVDVLESIETSKYDQHEASAQIGQLLKEIYIDSALKEDEKRDKSVKKKEKKRKVKNISWKEYKQRMVTTN